MDHSKEVKDFLDKVRVFTEAFTFSILAKGSDNQIEIHPLTQWEAKP
jgi:hypothetical protein